MQGKEVDIEQTTLSLWERLKETTAFEFTSKCRSIPPSYSLRKGKGQVIVRDPNLQTVTFFEKGNWIARGESGPTAFTNVLRWCLDTQKARVSIEHLRMGVEHPVLLATLEQVGDNLFKSFQSHECKRDTYFGSVLFDEHYIQLSWRVVGPRKNEHISVVYS